LPTPSGMSKRHLHPENGSQKRGCSICPRTPGRPLDKLIL
jgi:hypothetical protein